MPSASASSLSITAASNYTDQNNQAQLGGSNSQIRRRQQKQNAAAFQRPLKAKVVVLGSMGE